MSITELMKQEDKLSRLEDLRERIHIIPTTPRLLISRTEKLEKEIQSLRSYLDAQYQVLNQIMEGSYE